MHRATSSRRSPQQHRTVPMAAGSAWADALTGTAAMASLGGPPLRTPTGTSTLAPPSADALHQLRPQPVVISGGTGAVSAGAAGQAAQHLNASSSL